MTLREIRKAKGYTLERLAQMCGTNKSQLSHIENGSRNITEPMKQKLNDILGEFEMPNKTKFTCADAFENIGEVYGYISTRVPDSSTNNDFINAVEHPTYGLLQLFKKAIPQCILTQKENIWISEVISEINLGDYKKADRTASKAEQSAFLIGYYKGVKKASTIEENKYKDN